MKTLTTIALSIPFIIVSQSAFSCDDKPCETTYLSATSQHVSSHGRNTARTEREAHALIRERRDYALQTQILRNEVYSSKK